MPGAQSLRKLQKLRDWTQTGAGGMAINNSAFGSPRLLALLSRDLGVDLSVREAVWNHFARGTPIEALLRVDQEVYLVSVLHRQDRISMGASVEARVPFLDHHVVEAANRLPIEEKLSGGIGKGVLRHAAKGLIPSRVIDRRKMGFPIPLDAWLREGRLAERLDVLLEGDTKVASYVDRSGVRRMVEEHRAGERNHCEDLWILLSLEMWHRRFLTSAVPNEAATAGTPVLKA